MVSESPRFEQKILIVDDQFFNIQALEIILKYVVKVDVEKVCVRAYNGI